MWVAKSVCERGACQYTIYRYPLSEFMIYLYLIYRSLQNLALTEKKYVAKLVFDTVPEVCWDTIS